MPGTAPGDASPQPVSQPVNVYGQRTRQVLNLDGRDDDPVVVEPEHVACGVEHSKARVRPCRECEVLDAYVDAQLPRRGHLRPGQGHMRPVVRHGGDGRRARILLDAADVAGALHDGTVAFCYVVKSYQRDAGDNADGGREDDTQVGWGERRSVRRYVVYDAIDCVDHVGTDEVEPGRGPG